MLHPLIQITSSSSDVTAWISSFASLFAAVAAGYAIYLARHDLKEARRQSNAQMTYQIQRDLLDLMSSRNVASSPQEKTLFYFSMFSLIEADTLSPGLESMVRRDIQTALDEDAFREFWSNERNVQDYPMEFQNFIKSGGVIASAVTSQL